MNRETQGNSGRREGEGKRLPVPKSFAAVAESPDCHQQGAQCGSKSYVTAERGGIIKKCMR